MSDLEKSNNKNIKYKYLIKVLIDASIALLSIFIFAYLGNINLIENKLVFLIVATFILANYIFGIYRTIISYNTPRNYLRQGISTGTSFILSSLMLYPMLPIQLGLSIHLSLFSFSVISRAIYQTLIKKQNPDRTNVLIYGAGLAGQEIAAVLKTMPRKTVRGFIDDDKALQNRTVGDNIKIYSPNHLQDLIQKHNIAEIYIAIPKASDNKRREILSALSTLSVKLYSLPNYSDIISGKTKLSNFNEIKISDILGRDSVKGDKNLLGQTITNKTVLITGAGGSIGTEITRQVLKLNPKSIILVDNSEFALYQISAETNALSQNIPIYAKLGSVSNKHFLEDVFQCFEIDSIFHTAAYKHVPIVEDNPFIALENNVLGTYLTAHYAIQHGCKNFTLISTDKAVNPTNVMGATKRLAEIVIQGLNTQQHQTKLSIVRFGNVLGSSGSVIPLFQKQIDAGGPVTLTHEEITRFFMTIPEAAQLVIQAGTLANSGDVCVLDMGEPVKIKTLAEQLISLNGKTVKTKQNPNGDIEIITTGLRPGEKLYEELVLGNNLQPTQHPMIMKATEEFPAWAEIDSFLKELPIIIQEKNYTALIKLMNDFVSGYKASKKILSHSEKN